MSLLSRALPGAPDARCLATLLLSLAAAGTGLGGCTRSVSTGIEAGTPLQSTVRLQLAFTRVGRAQNTRFDGQGHFVRYHAADAREVPTLLGMPDDDEIPLDTCVAVDQTDALDKALGAVAEVRLLDAGRLTARRQQDAIGLLPTHYPELTPFVAGVVYAPQESAPPLLLETGAVYEVSGEGGEEIGPFDVQVAAPRAFPELSVWPYARGGDMELRWAEAGEASDPLVLTVSWAAHNGAAQVRCRVRDDGSFQIGRELLSGLAIAPSLETVEVAALRSRRAAVSAPGVDGGQLTVTLRSVLPLPWVPVAHNTRRAAPFIEAR